MKFEKVNPDIVNKLFRATKLQRSLEEFLNSGETAMKCVFAEDEYSNLKSAQSSYRAAIRRLGYPIAARTMNGSLYLIHLDPSYNTVCDAFNPMEGYGI